MCKPAEFELRARGRVMLFDGYTKVMPQINKKDGEEDNILPDMKVGEV
jgi:DNA topoisomerase-1